MTATPIVTTLLDPVRLMVAGSLAGTERSAADVAARTGLEEPDVVTAIGSLRQVGLVEQTSAGFTLPVAGLRRLVAELAHPNPRRTDAD